LKIHLPSYSQSLHLIEESLKPDEVGLHDSFYASDIHARLHLDRHDPYLDFKISLKTRLHLECDRCLEPFEFALLAEGTMIYILGNPPRGQEIDDSEFAYVPLGTRDLDISDVLRDLLVLSLPPQVLCKEGCLGLCSHCGINLNTETCSCEQPKSNRSLD
jgi:uncharacterized protein